MFQNATWIICRRSGVLLFRTTEMNRFSANWKLFIIVPFWICRVFTYKKRFSWFNRRSCLATFRIHTHLFASFVALRAREHINYPCLNISDRWIVVNRCPVRHCSLFIILLLYIVGRSNGRGICWSWHAQHKENCVVKRKEREWSTCI